MKDTSPISLIEHLSVIPDPRIENMTHHQLIDVLVITICAVICGANDYRAIEEFGVTKEEWFKSFLELPNGIPSHDTFNRIFQLISPEMFERSFLQWVAAITGVFKGSIAIDGKTLRRSYDRNSNKAAIHMVSAWAAESEIVLGQVKTDEKSNEITAIPELLSVLSVKGCIVSIDAMGCQKNIVKQINEQGGDYVVAVKDNQPKLAAVVKEIFDEADRVELKGYDMGYHETTTRNHGRTEVRRYCTLPVDDLIPQKSEWEGLKTIGMVESQRTVKGETTIDCRYYICSIENDAELFAKCVRAHWGIENKLHWVLDVAFREDESRARRGHSAENFAILRHIALNLLNIEKTTRLGVHNKRLKAGWNHSYLLKLLSAA